MTLAVVQARTSSRRLPGKVHLPLGGLPLAVLVARRAATTGRRVVVATSNDASDDALAEALADAGVECHRGPLDDVLARVVGAIRDVPDDAPVVRLTADNPLPDGAFIDEVEAEFLDRGLDYIGSADAASGLPYGVSAEITRAGHLRTALRDSPNRFDREHVTSAIRSRFGPAVFGGRADLGMAHFRATIDCLDDYTSLSHVFAGVRDPVAVPWTDLVDRLRGAPFQPVLARPARRLVLGTAQLGSDYGIMAGGQPAEPDRQDMLRQAVANGVSWLDTARSYGDAEATIGRFLAAGWQGRARVVTKLSTLARCGADTAPDAAAALAEASVFRSCAALGVPALDRLLLHRAAHLDAWDGAVFEKLRTLRNDGVIGALGVSVQSPSELARAVDCPDVAHVQIPANILDRRWNEVLPLLERVRAERELTVHIRSALLQGLLTSGDPALWRRAHMADGSQLADWLGRRAGAFGRRSVVDLCLAWARAQAWADGVVVGCDGPAQLRDTLELFDTDPLTREEVAAIAADRPQIPEDTLDPSTWSPT